MKNRHKWPEKIYTELWDYQDKGSSPGSGQNFPGVSLMGIVLCLLKRIFAFSYK